MQKGNDANWYFEKADNWQECKKLLREIALSMNLTETLTYGKPTYCSMNGKLFLIHTFKDYIAILFFKGVLFGDPKKILIQQTVNVQAGRQLRFKDLAQAESMKETIKEYIQIAIEVEKSGKKVEYKTTNQYPFPEELQARMDTEPKLAEAFYALTPGRQRGYLLYIGSAKQSQTPIDRITLSIPYILKGKGRSKTGGFED
jgi:uncharacterized protein YdeI (YjbR/CyaY-like superfamily)